MRAWDFLYIAGAPVFLPVVAWKRVTKGKYRESFPAMLGRRLPENPLPAVPRCWLHSVSVGETVAAGAVFHELRRRRPEWDFLSTTTTETGQAQARKSLAEAGHHTYVPFDLSGVVGRFLDTWRPTMLMILETELWPNLLLECRARRIPVFLVNGKLSARSAERYERFSGLFRPALEGFELCLMQTEEYAARMERVLGARERVRVTGNVKFDALPAALSAEERAALRAEWGVREDEVLIVAGSTHEGEERLVAEAVEALRAGGRPVRLLMAPRHPERFDAVAALLGRMAAGVHRLSAGPAPSGGAPVLLLDKMRVLARSFGGGDIAIVGGSWKPVGGHNLLEAAIHGMPVVCGPHMFHQPEIMRILQGVDADPSVPDYALRDRLGVLVDEPALRAAIGARARAGAEANKGAAGRTVDAILAYLDRLGGAG